MGRQSKEEKAIEAKLRELNKAFKYYEKLKAEETPDPYLETAKYNRYILELRAAGDVIAQLQRELAKLENPE